MSLSAAAADADVNSRSEPLPSTTFAGRWGFRLVNLWLVIHVACVVIGPSAVEPCSEFQLACWRIAAPYLQLLYLNHGYHFFAPEPAASTLVKYELAYADGRKETGQLPHRGIAPRLLYHRHFMLTEFIGNLPPELRPVLAQGYARHLLLATGAQEVTLTRVTHALPRPEEIRRGRTLHEPESFSEELLGHFALADVQSIQPPAPPAGEKDDTGGDSDEQVPASKPGLGSPASAAPTSREERVEE